MTKSEKIDVVRALIDDVSVTDELITVYLDLAQGRIFNRLYPFGKPSDVTEVPEKYEMLHCELTSRMFMRRGAEGQTGHTENGIARTYGSVNDEDLLAEIMQIV